MVAFEPKRLIHVLQQTSRCRDKDVHPRQPVLLVLQVLPSNDQTRRELMLVADLAKNLEDLDRLRQKKRVNEGGMRRKGSIRTSSRVGEMTSAPSPSCGPHLFLRRTSRTGMRKASVFPLPVRAAPRTSFPFKARGRERC